VKKATIIIVTAILSTCIIGCNSKNKSTEKTKDTIGITIKKDSLTLANNSKDSTNKKSAQFDLIGVWVAKDFDTPAFEIRKSTIYYFRSKDVVPYQIVGDSIHINLDKDVEPHPTYLFTLKGRDTLIFTSNDGLQNIAYRMKK